VLTRTDVVELLERHDLEPSRALGQNFVVDRNTVERVARLAGVGPGDRVVEVGAGLGSLTLALLATGASVTAVEVDRHLVPLLREVVEPEGATVVEADATTADWDRLLGAAGPWTLVANLPYNVATAIVLDVLDRAPQVTELLVMVQKEVGERMAAGPGTKAYGIPSLRVAYWADAEVVGTVPRTVFHPKPKVDSALVRIRRLPAPAVDGDLEAIFRLVRAGFGQRRKMLRRALAEMVQPDTFVAADVAPEARAEELELPAWARLADAVASQVPRPPEDGGSEGSP
jgi:16S rRNA (adenine1518-N6/adenine1519-N6)-dimethyltransferase